MMSLALVLMLAGADATDSTFVAGNWEGSCVRLEGDKCAEYEVVNPGPVTLRFRRTASTIIVYTEPEDCARPPMPAAVNPAYSATTMTHLIRGRVVIAMRSCGSSLNLPDLRSEDIAEILRQTQDVAE